MDTNKIIENVLDRSHTNWDVIGLVPSAPITEDQPVSFYETPKQKCLYRSDNGAYLDVVGKRYGVMQNREMLTNLVTGATQLGIDLRDGSDIIARCFKGGKAVSYAVPLDVEDINGTIIKRYLTTINNHGSGSHAYGSLNYPVRCDNQFYRIRKTIHRKNKFRHSANITDVTREAIPNIISAIKDESIVMQNFKRWSGIDIDSGLIEACEETLFNPGGKLAEDISPQAVRAMEMFKNARNIEFNDVGKNVFGLFNAVTRLYNHDMNPHSKTSREEYVQIGTGNTKMNAAYDLLLEIV